jgi:DNA-damage-inducible protein D
MANELINFEHTPIRKTLHDEAWYFSIIDIIAALIESSNHQTYWYVLKKREPQLLTICKKFKFLATDGKMRPTDCANTEGVFRIIMSIPSPKAEPLKMWLAEQGKRTIDEAENPELLTQRQIELYKAKGYPDEWINERVKNIDIRNN